MTLALALALGGTHASGVSLLGDQLRDLLRRALERHPEVLEAYLFASKARGSTQAHSDVDVAVYVAHIPDAPFGYAAELGAELMSALGENLVDVTAAPAPRRQARQRPARPRRGLGRRAGARGPELPRHRLADFAAFARHVEAYLAMR